MLDRYTSQMVKALKPLVSEEITVPFDTNKNAMINIGGRFTVSMGVSSRIVRHMIHCLGKPETPFKTILFNFETADPLLAARVIEMVYRDCQG